METAINEQSASGVGLSELVSALSYALDITEGHPTGHCVRCCWIGFHVGLEFGLDSEALANVYYTILLKDVGCSSNAARICQLYLADDIAGAFIGWIAVSLGAWATGNRGRRRRRHLDDTADDEADDDEVDDDESVDAIRAG